MHPATYEAFADELQKIASILASPKADLAGLGILALPSLHTLVSKDEKKKEKAKAGFEVAGLGTLAAHTLATMNKAHP